MNINKLFNFARVINFKIDQGGKARFSISAGSFHFVTCLIGFSFFSAQALCVVSVGDSYGGGTVFCVSQTPDIARCIPEGSGNFGLIMANEDQVNFHSNPKHGVVWSSEYSKTGALSDDDGAANTAAIIAAHPQDNPSNNAAWLCHSYNREHGQDTGQNLTGWYLPSKNELNKMYLYAKAHELIGMGCVGSRAGGVQCLIGGYDYANGVEYWSSTEYSGNNNAAWPKDFRDGGQGYGDKDGNYFGVRAVRAFINLSIQPFNNLPKSQIKQAVEKFIYEAKNTTSVDISELQAIPNADTLLPIFDWLKTNRTVRTLNLAHTALDSFIEPLSDLIATRTDLTTINLSNCNLHANSIRRLFLQGNSDNRELTALYLGWNDVGAWTLAGVLTNYTGLTTLDLRGNQIGNELSYLIVSLKNNRGLTTLDLGLNDIDDAGAQQLAAMLQNNTALTTLGLEANLIDDDGAIALAKALRTNTTLTTLDLRGNQITDEGVREINVALVDNYNLFPLCDGTRNNLLLKLLRKIKRASSFTFAVGLRHEILREPLLHILEFAGLNVRNRAAFADVRDYNTENNRRIIFGGTLEEVMRLFYYGDRADYAEIIREVNQIRRLQREILQENHREIPGGWLLELPEGLQETYGATLTHERVVAAFWPAS